MILLPSKIRNVRDRILKEVVKMRLDENLCIKVFENPIRSNKSECIMVNNRSLTSKGLIALLAFPGYQFYVSFLPIFSS